MNQSLLDFKDRLTEDAQFYKKFKDLQTTYEVVQLATEEGYFFTEDELINDTELSDAELAAAAGGLTASIAGDKTDYRGIIGI